MTVVVTMAGLGSRFSSAGYVVPKYKVSARGCTLFEWSMRSLLEFRSHSIILATLGFEDSEWLLASARSLGFNDVRIVKRDSLSRGQAETAFDAVTSLQNDCQLWIYNIDTYVTCGLQPQDIGGAFGCIHVFPSAEPGMSFVRYGDTGAVTEVAEKRVISGWATVGMYGFADVGLYRSLYQEGYDGHRLPTVNGERYIAPLYELLLAQGCQVVAPKLKSEAVHILGTPAQVQAFDSEALPPTGSLA